MRTCQKILVVAAAALVATQGFCGIGATQTWVANYVSNYVSSAAVAASRTTVDENGVTHYSFPGGIDITCEPATETALVLKRATATAKAAGWTDGLIFAYAGGGIYRNGGKVITATPTNLVCSIAGAGCASVLDGRTTWMARADGVRLVSIAQTMIQPAVATRILERGAEQ